MTHYEVLEIDESANEDEIKKAYRRLSKEYHPDRVPEHLSRLKREAEEKFKQLNIAYHVLSDTYRRRQYDELLLERKRNIHLSDTNRKEDRIPSASETPRASKHKSIFRFRTVAAVVFLLATVIGLKNIIFPGRGSEGQYVIRVNNDADSVMERVSGISGANISGQWRGFWTENDAFSSKQIISFNLRVKQDHGKITGTIRESIDDKPYTAKIKGTVRGRTIAFGGRYARLNAFVKYDGSIFESGNVAHGTWNAGNRTGEWRIERYQTQPSGPDGGRIKDEPSIKEPGTNMRAEQQVSAEKKDVSGADK